MKELNLWDNDHEFLKRYYQPDEVPERIQLLAGMACLTQKSTTQSVSGPCKSPPSRAAKPANTCSNVSSGSRSSSANSKISRNRNIDLSRRPFWRIVTQRLQVRKNPIPPLTRRFMTFIRSLRTLSERILL